MFFSNASMRAGAHYNAISVRVVARAVLATCNAELLQVCKVSCIDAEGFIVGMTIAEKILAKKGGRSVVRPGDIVTVEVDTTILFDNNFIPANTHTHIQNAMKFTGRIWKYGDNINTDLILPNVAFYLTPQKQLKYVFRANRPGWVDLVQPGDILIRNLGTGKMANAKTIPPQLLKIVAAGGIFSLLEQEGAIAPRAS
jgi:hypothetical protein